MSRVVISERFDLETARFGIAKFVEGIASIELLRNS